jgi:enamine deaminase RidA (YjgF/YER057c/UK114 family)
MRFLWLLATAAPYLWPQAVVQTSDVRFVVANPKPTGTLMEQVELARWTVERPKVRVARYRAFVRSDADPGQISSVLRAPALSIIKVASLPHPGQKISVEAVTNGGNNPNGLVFISGQGATATKVMPNVVPLATEAFDNIGKALKGVQLEGSDVLAVTCFMSSIQDVEAIKEMAARRYPEAVINNVQIPLGYGRALAECEALARAKQPVAFVYPEGLSKSPNFTQVTGISTKKMIWSGLTVSKGCGDTAVKKMFQSLETTLSKNGASIKNVAFSYLYPNSVDGTDLTRSVRFDFYNKAQAPASTLVPFAGFFDKNACTGVEVAAPVN